MARATAAVSPYAYASNDPLNHTDPLGLWSLGSLFHAAVSKVKSAASRVVTAAQHVVHAVTGTVTPAAQVVASTVAHAYHAVTTGLQNIAAIARKDAGQVFHVLREGATRVVHAVGDAVRRSVGAVARTATSVGHWFKKHSQIIGKIGKILSNVSGALALAGLAIAPIPGLDFLTPVLEGAALATAAGGLAAEGIAKAAGDRNITYGDLLTAAVGIIPGGGDAEDAAEGLNLASHAPEEGETLFRGTSEGFEGSPGLRAVGVTPATTDPVVGAIFATHAEQFGTGVLHIASPADLAGVKILPGNVLSGLEREVAVEITPTEFAARAGTTISSASARSILGDMGYSIPGSIATPAGVQAALENTGRMSGDEIAEFISRAGG